jgi:uncharacterized membrane protein HdeD (DUF308 family)
MREETLAQNWWSVLIRGLVAIGFALIAWFRPGLTVAILLVLFAAYVIEDGIMAFVGAVRASRREERWWPQALEGICGITLGLVAILLPAKALGVAFVLIAVWALVTGVLELIAAARMRRRIDGWPLMGLSGLWRLAFGIVLVLRPTAGLYTLLWVTAAYAFVDGIILVALSLRLKRRAEQKQMGAGGMTPEPV